MPASIRLSTLRSLIATAVFGTLACIASSPSAYPTDPSQSNALCDGRYAILNARFSHDHRSVTTDSDAFAPTDVSKTIELGMEGGGQINYKGTIVRFLSAHAVEVWPAAKEAQSVPRRSIVTIGHDDTLALGELIQREAEHGKVTLPRGTCLLSSTLLIPGGTELVGNQTRLLTNMSWDQRANANQESFTLGFAVLSNRGYRSNVIADQNISVSRLVVDYTPLDVLKVSTSGTTHAVSIRMASHIRIRQVVCIGGNDCVALLADHDTQIEGSVGFGVVNAGFDHWEGCRDSRVISSAVFCPRKSLYGILFTGTDTTGTKSLHARNFVARGNEICGCGAAAIWINALSQGSSVEDTLVTNNLIDGRGVGSGGIRVSGRGAHHKIHRNLIKNVAGGQAIALNKESRSGEAPSESEVSRNSIWKNDLFADAVANIAVLGNSTVVSNNDIMLSKSASSIWIGGDRDLVGGNHSDQKLTLNLTNATRPNIAYKGDDLPAKLDGDPKERVVGRTCNISDALKEVGMSWALGFVSDRPPA